MLDPPPAKKPRLDLALSDSDENNFGNNGPSDQCVELNDNDSEENDVDDNDCSNEHEYDDDMLLSDVHIHPQNGRVDGRLLTSIFPLSLAPQTLTLDNEDEEDTLQNNDGDQDWDHAVEIQHAMGTSLRAVGSQVWMGSFLLIDWMVTLIPELNCAVVLELGAGTGLASIACSLLTPASNFFCTDFDTAVLLNCQHNIDTNLPGFLSDTKATTTTGPGHVLCRRLNWLMDCPLDPVEGEPDQFSWTDEDRKLWISQGAYIIAADVVYDDSLTDALVECLERLLKEPLPETHPRHPIGRVAYVTMEKRYNFSLDQLAVVAQAYDYFVRKISESLVLEAERIDPSNLERHCDYDRSKDLQSSLQMSWAQTTIRLPAKSRGCHLVTNDIERQLPELRQFSIGMANVFLQHTSASLSLNENADPDVRVDMEMALNRIAPEDFPYTHTDEGPDDMTGHLKSSLLGVSLNIPITNGRFNLGMWQGIWLCEHRNHASGRKIVVTLQGEKKK